MSSYFIPLRDFIELLPGDWVDSLGVEEGPFDNYGIRNYRIRRITNGLYAQVEIGLNPYASDDAALVLALPPFPDLGLVFRRLGRSQIWFAEDFLFHVSLGAFSFRLPNQILKPVVEDVDGAWVEDPNRAFAEIDFSFATVDIDSGNVVSQSAYPLALTVDRNGTFDFDYPLESENGQQILPEISLNGPAMLGESGVVITAEGIRFNFNFEDPVVSFDQAKIMLPSGLTGSLVLPDIIFQHAELSRRGFSGRVTADWPLEFRDRNFVYLLDGIVQDANIFGLNGGLNQISLDFENNQITGSSISGGIIVPYFDEPVDLSLQIQSDGNFAVTLAGVDDDGITLRKDELVAANVQAITLSRQAETVAVILTGGLQPLLFASNGLTWPRLDVKELSIEQNLADLTEPPVLKFQEAWLDLKDLATLDLFGFHFELNRIGLGYEDTTDKLWIDLTGMVKLIDQIPIGVGVEGFRITWPRTLYQDLGLETLFQEDPSYSLTVQDALDIAGRIEVKFDGVYLFYGVPQAVEFEGYIRFLKEAQKVGFAGDVILRVPASGLEIEAGLMIGMNFAQPSPYPFLYVYFGILLPSGIPLGQSGLALKGAKGLFGLNVTPAKTDEQNWYYDWYKRGPIEGAHPTNKWEDLQWALALGAGVTITTTDGKILGVQGLLVLAIPGPFIMIEGKALIFDGVFPGDPPLKALGVFDGRAKTVQLNIEAGAELIEDMLEANGVAEAFFDFKDLTNWHLYLGQDEPQDRRVHALILKLAGSYLFKADAYLMTDMIQPYTVRSRLGVFIGFQPPIPPLGPVNVTLDAVINGDGELQIRAGDLVNAAVGNSLSAETALDSVNFSGNLELDANLDIAAFGFGLRASARAGVMCEGPKPFEVKGKLAVSVEVPLPLEAVESIPLVGDFLEFIDQAVDLPEIEPIEIELEFAFSAADFAVPDLVSPLRRTNSMESHFIQKSEEIFSRNGLADVDQAEAIAKRSPTVEMDHRPVLIFDQEMNIAGDGAMASPIAAHPAGVKQFHQGMVTFTPTLNRIMLFEHQKSERWDEDAPTPNADEPDANWVKIADTHVALPNSDEDIQPFFGIWRADADTENPEQSPRRTLRLWSTMPFGPAIGPAYYISVFGHQNQVVAAIKAHEQFFVDASKVAETFCIHFEDVQKERWERPDGLKSKRSRLPVDNPLTIDDVVLSGELGIFTPPKDETQCLLSPGNLRIAFPKQVAWVEIQFGKKIPDDIIAEAPTYIRGEKDKQSPGSVVLQYQSIQVNREVTNAHTIEISSAQGFDRITIMRSSWVCKVCYKFKQDLDDEAADESQLCINGQLFTPSYIGSQPVLKPGTHYRIAVQSVVAASYNPDRNPFPSGTFLHDQAATLATNIVHSILGESPGTRAFTDEAYFQTDGPPSNLQRLIKWTTPQNGARRFFLNDDFSIRFKRPYIRELYADEEFKLDAYVRSSNGTIFDRWDMHWSKSQSATLTPDEQAWMDHLQTQPQFESLVESVAKDDVLRISNPQIADLSPETGSGWTTVDLDSRLSGQWKNVIDSRFGIPTQMFRQLHQTRTIAVAKNSKCSAFFFFTTLSSSKPNALGVVFRYVDAKNYYRFSIDRQSTIQQLTKVVNGKSEVLITKDLGFELNRLLRLSVAAAQESPNTSHFEIRLNGQVWGQYSDNDMRLEAGSVGLYSAGNNDANFINPWLVVNRPLTAESRYELIIAGGNGGELVFGDSYAESSLQQTFGSTGWSLGAGSAWQVDVENRKITKIASPLDNGLIVVSPRVDDCDIRAKITGLTNDGHAGFVIRSKRPDQSTLEETRQYRALVSKVNGKLHLCVCYWNSTGEEVKLCDELVTSESAALDGFDFRVNIFGTRLKVFLFHHLAKEISIKQFSSQDTNPSIPLLLEGGPGIIASAGVSFEHLQIRRSELLKIPFMTSKFSSFGEMIDTGHENIHELIVQPGEIETSDLENIENLITQYAYQRLRRETGTVDYRDGSMDRETFEAVRQDCREAKAVLDDSFAGTCNKLTDDFYNPLSDRLELNLLRTKSGICGLYIRSPESLNLATEIDPGLLNNVDDTSDLNAWELIGATKVEVFKDKELFDQPVYILFNGDENHLLILLKPFNQDVSTYETGAYVLRFHFSRNHQDEIGNIDHRYDRPILSSQGFDTHEIAELHWTID